MIMLAYDPSYTGSIDRSRSEPSLGQKCKTLPEKYLKQKTGPRAWFK
jgi:hypothetical protein